MVKHGYTTCVTCHYDPSGGGALKSYGKFVAGELLGAFNTSENALPWLVKPTEDAHFIASFLSRGVQSYVNTPRVQRADFRKMQADIEGGYTYNEWLGLAAIGPRLDSLSDGQNKSDIIVRRYFAGYMSLNFAVRAGKFFPEYGINYYNHNIPTRKGLYFDHNQEPNTLQASYFSDAGFDAHLALLKGNKETKLDGKKGFSSTLTYSAGTTRSGISHMNMRDSSSRTNSSGAYSQIGYLKKGYTLVEVDRKETVNIKGHRTTENLGFIESGWEVIHAVNAFVSVEYSSNLTTKVVMKTPYIGLQIHPITHTEIIAQLGKTYATVSGKTESGIAAFAMFNVYF